MEPAELARWTRFAAKGGIGKCTALQDCVAESTEQLMFLQDDEITVLMKLTDQEGWYLGYCEGVVGRFQGHHVQFNGKLKKPVMTKRSSSLAPRPSSSSKSSSPTTPTLSPPDLDVARFSFGTSMRPTSSQLSLVASSSSYHDIQMSEEDGPAPPSVSYSSSSTGPESGLDTPLDSPSQILESPVCKSPLDETLDPPGAIDSPSEQDKTPVQEDANELLVAERSAHSLAPPTLLSADPSIAETEQSSRISLALSDGETGIGLSLLQGMVNDEDDDSSIASEQSDNTRTLEQMHEESEVVPEPAAPPDVPIRNSHSRGDSGSKYTRGSLYGESRASLHSHSSSTGEWEGASDIYDDYRYSRYSMASKLSRFSQASMYTLGSDAPPIPQELLANTQTTLPLNIRRRSVEVEAEAESVYSQQLSPTVPVMGEDQQLADAPPTPRPEEATQTVEAGESNHTPAHLDFSPSSKDKPVPIQSTPSPLLHTTFGSPVSSPTQTAYPSGTSLLSPPFTAPISNSSSSKTSGVATALREKLERDRPGPSVSPHPDNESGSVPQSPLSPKSSHGIIVEDDEGMPDTSSAALPDTPSTASSYPDSHAIPPTELEDADYGGSKSPIMHPPPKDQVPSPSTEEAIPKTQLATPDGGLQPRRRPSAQGQEPNQFIRSSLFMPHPNAPKAPASTPAGPMYGRVPLLPQQMPTNSLVHTLRMAAAMRYGPNGAIRRTTIYGMCKVDLSTSTGPVPIIFSLEPPQSIPANRLGEAIRRPSTTGPSPPGPGTSSVNSPSAIECTSSAPPPPAPQAQEPQRSNDAQQVPAGNVVPRANFFPKAPRPRSRSFSGFDSPIAEMALAAKETSNVEDGKPRATLQQSTVVAARTVSASAAMPVAAQQATLSHQLIPGRRMTHGSSPLAMSSSSSVPSSPTTATPKSPSSPSFKKTSQVFNPPPLVTLAQPSDASLSTRRSLRQVASAGALRSKPPSSPLVASPPIPPMPLQSGSTDSETSRELQSLDAAIVNTQASDATKPGTPESPQPRVSLQRTRSGDTDTSHYSETRSLMTSPPPASTHRPSLRAKMSLPSLHIRNSRVTSPGPSTPLPDAETVQVKDMDFELVRPTIPNLSSSRTSEDSMAAAREGSVLVPEGQSLLRPYSPALSSLSLPRSPTAPSEASGFPRAPSDSENPSIEAHRQRELKWISLMSSTPASQARRSKKVKKLLLEGVPASVRSNVWQHLTDSKSKRIDGLYLQVGKRGKVPALADIERDAKNFFPEKAQFQSPEGPVVYLLQAYLTMVPDIQYHPGLTLVAGQLLHQSIEEDAFWIFVSLMDSHLRPYFSSSTAQIEVDATLFSKALEANDASLAKRLFADMAIPPVAICRSWFCSIFAHALPPETLHRVWDLFLLEGVVFLLRVGLAVAASCRKPIMESNKADVAVNLLRNPPPSCLPSNPETFIALACGMKLKDDDVRKQRNKMEAQAKRQTQRATGVPSGSGPQTASISLPRAPAEK